MQFCQGVPRNLNSIVKLKINKKNSKKNLQTITKYKVVNKSSKISLILYKPLTGKTHQLRIVSKYLNCPIIGDAKYGKNKSYSKEQLMLNALYLQFVFKNHQYEFSSVLPKNILKFMKRKNLTFPKDEKVKYLTKVF